MSDEEPDIAGSCGCVPNSILPRISFFTRRECTRNNVSAPDGWIRFGTVKHLVIYPIDHGTGFDSDSVICTSDGPEFDTQNPDVRNVKDRRLVVYNAKPENLEVCLEPSTNIVNCTLNQMLYGDTDDFENNKMDSLFNIEKKYDNQNIIIQRRRGLLDNQDLQNLYINKHRFYRVGYFSAQRRRALNSATRFTNENSSIRGLLPNFSHYTLINNKSLQCLKSSFQKYMKEQRINGNAKQVSYLNFFPHIVVEGDSCSEFQEDFVTRVKIGNVEFGEILPCIHDASVNFNRSNPNRRLERLHEYLTNTRPLFKVHSEINHENSRLPAFGINMEKLDVDLPDVDDNNRIRKNDIVYVQFQDIPLYTT